MTTTSKLGLLSLCAAVGILPSACGDSSTAPQYLETNYTVTTLGNSGFSVTGLNNAGQLVGNNGVGQGPQHVLIDHGTTTDLGSCAPAAINDAGVVACTDSTLWQNGTITTLPLPALFDVQSIGVNDQDVVAGGGTVLNFAGGGGPCASVNCAFIATSGHLILIPGGGGVIPQIAHGTDVLLGGPTSLETWKPDSTFTPYACTGLPANSSLYALGGDHEMVGAIPEAEPVNTVKTDAFVCKGGVMVSLGAETSRARDISESGLIVGTMDDGSGFLWNNGKLTMLGRVGELTGAFVTDAYHVNDAGQIVVTTSTGQTLLLTPK